MAGKKKKTKPAANPARGFATTSLPSKAKPEKDIADTSTEVSEKPSAAPTPVSAPSDESAQPAPPGKHAPARELHQLSPEELEAQLELSELQNVIEQQGPKVKKEASRQVARLHTERRVLRSQAEVLSFRDWLPDELMQQIVDLAIGEEHLSASNGSSTSLRRFAEDDLIAKIWQLHISLTDLDIPEEQINKVLEHVLAHPPAEDSANMVWGLSEALDWLALHSDSSQLLDYDIQKSKLPSSGTSAPLLDTVSGDEDKSQSGNAATRSKDRANGASSKLAESVSAPPIDDIPVSDIDSDMEPDEMLSTYLRTKARLFDRNPDLVGDVVSNGKKSKKQGSKPNVPLVRPTQGETKLQQRLKKIESDVLFDQHTADMQWLERRNDLMQDRADRRRLRLEDAPKDNPQSANGPDEKLTEPNASDDIMAEAEAAAQKLLEEMDEDDVGLGGMFGDPEDSPMSGPGQTGETAVSNITLRNFGKITGITPRRTFEEACRSRDPGAKVQYKLVSPTTYSARHSIIVSWSKNQEPIDSTITSDVEVQSNERKIIITMAQTSCPEVSQSESYVSTVALFLIFSNSLKEEKLALRLPPAFRDLYQELVESRREKRDAADRENIKSLRELIRHQTEKDDDEDVILTAAFRNRQKGLSGISTPVEGEMKEVRGNMEESEALKELWARKTSTQAYQKILHDRMSLPMFQFKDTVLDVVEKNQVTILCGETGCGKSTQMPAFILEHQLSRGRACKIYCTEPRRISAISLAQRVSEEMGEDKKAVGTLRSLVGYAVRLESHTTAQTRLVYATVGIVLRMLESAKGIDDITHLVIDEIHERSIDTDFLLIVLRSLMLRRPDLKVVLMSATVDAQRFSSYLDNAPIVTVPGRTYPVQAKFLEDVVELTGYTIDDDVKRSMNEDEDDLDRPQGDPAAGAQQLVGYSPRTVRTMARIDEYLIDYDLIGKLLESVAYNPAYSLFSQAILVFLPGIAEIRQLNDFLGGHPRFRQGWLVYPLHSSFSSEDQQAAFEVPPPGMRKIVLATNIAETGITIPDVTCVIDTGKHKEMRFDERRQLSRLIQSFISRANAKQRRGRAGRVQEGICFHLFTKYRHDTLMAEQQTPEMLRLSLQDLVMRVKICKLGDIEHALSQALDPPSLKNIRRAIDALIDVDALTQGEELTPLGQQLAKLPLDAQLGKLIVLASIFQCLDFALTTAAILSSKSPFLAPMNARKQAETVRLGFKRGNSDLLTSYNAYLAWKKVCLTSGQSELQFCRKNFLSPQNLANIEDLKSQLMSSIADAGFVSLTAAEKSALSRVRNSPGRTRNFVQVPETCNKKNESDLLLNAVTAWSFYPKLLIRDGKGWRNVANNQSISLHPGSVNRNPSTAIEAKFLSFYSIMQSASRFTNAQETSPVEAMALVLMAGEARFDVYSGVVIVDGNRLRFRVRGWKQTIVLKILRARIKEVIGRILKNPGRELAERHKEWMEVFLGLFERVEREREKR